MLNNIDRKFGLILFGILAVGALVVLSTLGEDDLWLDEMHSLLNSAGRRAEFEALPTGQILHSVPSHTDLNDASSVASVWRGMRADSHPPLFFILLYIWRQLCGDGDLVLRLPSALFSVLSILPVLLILREYGKPRAALVAASLLAMAYAHIHIGQQARPYSLAELLVGIGFWLLVRIERRWDCLNRRQRIFLVGAYASTACLAILTHYFAGLALLGQALFAAMRFRRIQLFWFVGGVLLAGVIVVIAWLPGFVAQLDFISKQDWVRETTEDHAWRTAARSTDLSVRLLLHHPLHDWTLRRALLQVLPGLAMVVCSLVIIRRRRCREATVFLLWFLVPTAMLASVDLIMSTQLLAHVRYPSLATPGLVGFLVVAAAQLRRSLQVILAALFAIAIASTLTLPATRNPQARQTATLLQVQIHRDDLLIFDAVDWHPEDARGRFVLVWHYLPAPYPAVLILDQSPSPQTREAFRSYNRVYVVSPRLDVVPNHTPETHRLADHWGYIQGIGWVYMFIRRST